jgi:hypothetical protein
MDAPRLTLDPVPPADRTGNLRFPVPLQGLRHAELHLPPDLTAGDVARIVALLETLVPPPADPPPV